MIKTMKNPVARSKNLSAADREKLLGTLQSRFEKHKQRHKSIKWADVQSRLEAHPDKLWSLSEMEETGEENAA